MRTLTGEAGGAIASPCVDVCRMEGGLCAGCLRTLEEIAAWSQASDAYKRAVLERIALRRARKEHAAAADDTGP